MNAHSPGRLHPATHLLVAFEIACIAVTLPTAAGTAVLGFFLAVALTIPPRTEFNLTGKFLKILFIGASFLFLIHGVTINPAGISGEGLAIGLKSFIRIASPVVFVIHVSRRIRGEELFAMLIDYRVPPQVILILFRTMWLVPRLTERMDEVMTAQKLRGMRVDTLRQRIRALLPTLNPIFSSMLGEIAANSLTITTRGFLVPGPKTHITPLRYRWSDLAAFIAVTMILGVLWC